MNRPAPAVSVLLRTRNRPWYLRQALEGLAAQTLRDFEALVINDGGEDVADLLAEFEGLVEIRYFHHQPGRGRCAALNRGLDEARGTYVAYLDDDDLYHPTHLETLVATLEREGADVAYSNADEVTHARRADAEGYTEVARSLKLDHDFNRARFFLESYIHLVTLVHRRACVERVGGFDEGIEVLEDLDFYFRLAQAYDFVHVRATTAEYRIRDDESNAVTSMSREFEETRRCIFEKHTHMILPEIFKYTEHKDAIVGELKRQVADLEQRLAALEGER